MLEILAIGFFANMGVKAANDCYNTGKNMIFHADFKVIGNKVKNLRPKKEKKAVEA